MESYALFLADHPVDQSILETVLTENLGAPYELYLTEAGRGVISSEADLKTLFDSLLPILSNDLHQPLTILITHCSDTLSEAALNFCHRHKKGRCLMLAEAVILAYLNREPQLIALAEHYFDEVSFEAMATAKAFVSTGLNASRVAQKLYLHRNTVNYRLQKFIEQSGLDIRDYHNAQLLYFCTLIKENTLR